jgi:hypothetical protein
MGVRKAWADDTSSYTSEMTTMQRCWECGVRRGICPVYLVGFARSEGRGALFSRSVH